MKTIWKIKVHTATAEESKEYEEKRRQEVMALEKNTKRREDNEI